MGLFENSVIVEEPLCASISEQHLCSEFLVQSVSEQQSCSEEAHLLADSNMNLASAHNTCLDFSDSKNSSCASPGDVTEMRAVDGDGLRGVCKDSLNDNQSNADVCKIESGCECLKEGGLDGMATLLGDSEIPWVVIPGSVSPRNSVRQDEQKDDKRASFLRVKAHIEVMEEKDDVLAGLKSDLCEQALLLQEMCAVDGDRLVDQHENADVSSLEHSLNNECVLSEVSLNENQTNVDFFNMESGGDCLKEGGPGGLDDLSNLSGDSEIPLVDMPGVDSPRNYVWPEEQKNDKSASGLSVEPAIEVMKEKDDVLTDIKSDLCEQASLLLDSETFSQLIPVNGGLSDNGEQNDLDFQSVNSPSLKNLNEISVASAGKESDQFDRVTSLLHGEMHVEVSHTNEEVSTSDWKNDQEEDNIIGCLSATMVSMTGTTIKLSHSTCLLETFEDESESPCSCNEQNEQMNTIIGNPPADKVMGCVEEKIDVTADIKLDVGSRMLPLEEKGCNLNEGSKCILDISVSSFGVVNDDSSERLIVPIEQNDASGPTKSSSAIDFSGKVDDEGKDNAKVDCVFESKNCDIVPLSSKRSNKRSKSNGKAPAKPSRKSRNGSKVLCPGESIKVALGDAKKKRSCSIKRVRSSMWGSLGSVTQLFEQTNGLKVHNSKSHKSKVGKKSGKQNKSGTKGRSQGSRGNQAKNTTLRLKVKLGKEVNQRFTNSMDTEVFDISTLSTAISRNLGTELCSQNSRGSTKVVNSAIDEWGEGAEEAKSCQGASVLDAQPASNGLDSNVIGENSAGDVRDNCLSMSSDMMIETSGEATESRCKDPGTSPDSEVINLTPDPHADSRQDEDFHGSVLTSAKNYTAPGDHTSNRRGKKKNTLSGSDSCIVEDRSCQPAKVNKAKPSKPYGRKKNISDTICFDENLISADVNAFSNSSSDKELSAKPGHLSGETQLGVSIKSFKVDSGTDAKTNCNLEMGLDASGNPLSDRDLFVDPLHFSGETGLGVNPDTFKVESGVEAKTNCNLDIVLNNSRNSLSGEELSAKLLHLPGNTAIGGSASEVLVDSGAEAKMHGNLEIALRLSKSGKPKNFLPAAKTKGNKIPKGSDSGSRTVNACSQKETQRKSGSKKKTKEKAVHNPFACEAKICPEAENHAADGTGKMSSGDNIASTSLPQLGVSPGDLGVQYLPQQDAWVCCDNCFQWRRISAEDADIINELKCTWICANNKNKVFADCSIPQEKSNAEINAELDISEVSGDENAEELGCKLPKVSRQTVTRIRTNQFLHRSRKTLNIDQIMVCNCKPPPDGKLGCGDKCLNRLLTIECVQGACPCGDRCSNRQFQKRHYAKLQKFRSGKKGFGLKLLEDLSEGQFLIEYVGEVLDMQAYLARQKEYALKGHKHFYFMTLNGSEVIDACVKGNLGRYINHSCDPNCRTEKWMVNGEVCIGLFALRDIKKGEEVTFDYNYERVFGAAAKKCYCGSPQCRGYIGGDPHNSEVVVYSDSDEEYSELVTPPEDAETEESLENRMPRAGSSDGDITQISESKLNNSDERDKKTNALGQLEMSTGMESVNQSVSSVPLLHDALELNSNIKLPSAVQPLITLQQTEDVKLMSDAQRECSMEESSVEKSSNTKMLGKSLCGGFDGNRKSKVDDKQVSSKEHSNLKTSRSSISVKKGKVKHSAQNSSKVKVAANKSQVLPINSKKKIEGSFVNHFEAVEENLNVLLDVAGGIRRDASRGYLKLLLLTAASGDSANGEAIQRNRDLSMILDALLKTKSQRVLEDIIKKNGLRMLHNIMKQHRGDFKKIPILRKLLKVLEYLADHEILKPDHINGGPPCPGMESFQESILSLTEHDDRQVHRIARKFRDKWIRRPLRKHGRDDNRTELYRGSNCNRFSASQNNWSDHGPRHTESKDCFEKSTVATNLVDAGIQEGSSAPCLGISPTRTTKTRKRKSRWDQPAEIKPDLNSLQQREKQIKQLTSSSSPGNGELPIDVYKLNREDRFCSSSLHNGRKNIFEDIPPGFSSPLKPHVSPPVAPTPMACDLKRASDAVIGHPQEKFVSRLPVSYGIPLSIMQQFGTPSSEPVGSWVIAPGMPFHPFPPLPPGPRVKKDPSPSEHVNHSSASQPAEERQQECHLPASFHSNESSPGTIGNQPVMDISSTNNQYASKRGMESSCDLGRRYFKQQKLNNTKSGPPPWHWRSNGWGCAENSKGSGNNASVGDVSNELSGTYCPEGLSSNRVENAGNNFYQHPEQHPSQN